jgi:RNA polymerase sigma-70 factor (ECF subfamily)
MEQRLTRARRRLRERGDYEGEGPRDAGGRFGAVLRAVYLLFNEGYWSTSDEAPVRADLCRLAVGLARSLHEAFAHEAEAAGLLALLLLHDARRGARIGPDGAPVPMPQQDRARWDRDSIAAATALLEATLARGEPGPMQIEAAVSAVHCRARSPAETDWAEIAALYGVLEALRPSPSVRVNRAFAVARSEGARAGLAVLDEGGGDERRAPYDSLVRGALLAEAGEPGRARVELERAESGARNAHERAQIRAQIEALGPAPAPATKRQSKR